MDIVKEEVAVATLSVSGLLKDLQNGLTRDDIAEKYDITKAEVREHFKHPKLKNRKTIKAPIMKFTLVDDTAEEPTATLPCPTHEEEEIMVKTDPIAEVAGEVAQVGHNSWTADENVEETAMGAEA